MYVLEVCTLTLYRMDLDALVQKNWNLECDLYMNKATQKYFFCIFWCWHLGCIKVLTIGIAMRNPVNYK